MLLAPVRMTVNPPGKFDAGLMLGIEQEYELFAGSKRLDFRSFFNQAISGIRSVPFRNCDSASILDAGYMLACDGPEAEFATAPIHYGRDGCLRLGREVLRCRKHILQLLRSLGVAEIHGYSTHLNISVPLGREKELAEALSTTVGPALVLLMEARQSPGLLIRPRRGRLEIGSEYIDREDHLVAASIFLTGVVHAYLHNPWVWGQFPRLKLKHWEVANIRPGIYLPHEAYGESIHEHGRAATLEMENGLTISAGELLQRCADLVLKELGESVNWQAADTLLKAAARSGLLPIELPTDPDIVGRLIWPSLPAKEARPLKSLACAQGNLGVTPRFVDWEGVAFSSERIGAALVVGIPWAQLPSFFKQADHNAIPQYVEKLGVAEGILTSIDQLKSPGVFRDIDPLALGTQALSDKGSAKNGGTGKNGGPSKLTSSLEPANIGPTSNSPTQGARPVRPWLPGLIGGLLGVGIIIGIAITFWIGDTRSVGISQSVTPTSNGTASVRLGQIAVSPSETQSSGTLPSNGTGRNALLAPSPSSTSTMTPTATSTITLTPSPTATPTITQTATLLSTPSSTQPAMYTVTASTQRFYFQGTICGDNSVTLRVRISDPPPAGMTLFFRTKDEVSGKETNWNNGSTMTSLGIGLFTITVPGSSFSIPTQGTLNKFIYQFVATDAGGNVIGRSPVYSDVELGICNP